MENRIPYHQKGKGIERGYSPPPRKRIRAPDLDTSDLIEENALTLIGRLTNPSGQLLWALFLFLSNRWTLRGKATGSDLGQGVFQLKFDFLEDMQQVLDNRPYHFDQWMVILQKWEPIIAPSFPSLIPFWIELQGLPKHFWKPEMLQTIGEELGEVLDKEITSSSVKIKVLLDGLQPLIKETIVDFPDGNEAVVYLDYQNLKNHCQHCQRLTHEKKSCPGIASVTAKSNNPPAQTSSLHASRSNSRNYYTPSDNFRAPKNLPQASVRSSTPQQSVNPSKRNLIHREERASPYSVADGSLQRKNYSREGSGRPRDHHRHYHSRDSLNSQHYKRGSDHIPPQQLQWREKSHSSTGQQAETSNVSRARRPPLERNLSNPNPPTPPPQGPAEFRGTLSLRLPSPLARHHLRTK